MTMEHRTANADHASTVVPQAAAAAAADGAERPVLRRVVYVVSQFPCWSETFIVREIHALIVIFGTQSPPPSGQDGFDNPTLSQPQGLRRLTIP